jgi:hypothetical protein
MATFINRGLSLLIATAYVVAALVQDGGLTAAKVAVGLLLPLACIWFSEALGEYGGTMRLHAITASTPGFLVCAGGWLLLVGVPLIAIIIFATFPQA